MVLHQCRACQRARCVWYLQRRVRMKEYLIKLWVKSFLLDLSLKLCFLPHVRLQTAAKQHEYRSTRTHSTFVIFKYI